MIINIELGTDKKTGLPFYLRPEWLRTHLHMLGSTGSGKTATIRNILAALALEPRNPYAIFIVDAIGNLSYEFLQWMANEERCPPEVRERLVYLEPARTEFVMPFNPLIHHNADELYYQVYRTVEIILRAWASQHIEEMPRLRHWMVAAFFAVAAMGYPIAMCRYLLRPGSDEHKSLLRQLPSELQNMWSEILNSRGGNEAVRLLESTRNRLAPFFDSGILRRMFSSVKSYFDVPRFIRERRIVILNLASRGQLDEQSARAIAGLEVNEIVQQAKSMSPSEVDPTVVLLDEFEQFVSEDLAAALPLVRQVGLQFILSHQSMSQLVRGDIDLTGIIWQCRSRLIFSNDADDANRLAEEFTYLTYDPYKLKEILTTKRQRIVGHESKWLRNQSHSETHSHAVDQQQGQSTAAGSGLTRPETGELGTKANNQTYTTSNGRSEKTADGTAHSKGLSETLVPIHEDFEEVSNKTYFPFDDQMVEWGKLIRTKPTGEAFGKFKDDPNVYDLALTYRPVNDTPEIRQKVEELIQRNFESDFFVPASQIESEAEELRLNLLRRPPIVLDHRLNSPPLGIPDKKLGEQKKDDNPYR